MYTNTRIKITKPHTYSYIKEDCGNLPVAVIDIDDTLGPLNDIIIDWAKEQYNKPDLDFKFNSFNLRELPDYLGVNHDEFFTRLKTSRMLLHFKVSPLANKILYYLRQGFVTDQEYHIALVTRRLSFWKEAVSLTRYNVRNNKIPHDSLHIIDYSMDKLTWAKETYGDRLAIIVEDHAETLEKSIEAGLLTFKVNQHYNAHVQHPNQICFEKGVIDFNGNKIYIV